MKTSRAALLALVAVSALLPGCPASEPESEPDARSITVRKSLADHPDHAKTRVLLLGFDGADMDVLDAMIEQGELPAFARMKKEGAFGKLRSISPMLSPVIWTTIATGKTPPVHGVIDFVVEHPETGEIMSVSSRARMVEAFWDIAGFYGSKVGVVGWLASWPAEPVNGFMVTDRVGILGFEYGRREDEKRARTVHPETLGERIKPLIQKVGDVRYETVRRFLNVSEETYRETYTRAPQAGNLVGNFRLLLASAETFRKVGLALFTEEKPRLEAVYFEFFDAVSHHFMPHTPPRMEHIPEPDFEKYKGAVAEACRYSDRTLAEAMEAADENTVILVVSDHGFRSGAQRLKVGAEFHDRAAAQWHRRFGVFFAWGKGVRPGARIGGVSVYDIAPTILGLMGFPRAEDMQGWFIDEAFTVSPPEATVATYERNRRDRMMGMVPEDDEGGDLQLKKWETMGYLGPTKTTSGHMNLGTYYLSENKLDEALAEFQEALLKDQSSARIHLSIGEVYQLMLKFDKAARAFRTAATLDPKMVVARLKLALMLKVMGRPQLALLEAKAALQIEPENPDAHLHMGLLLLDLDQEEEGIKELERAIELEPDFPMAHNQLGILLLGNQKFAEAEEQFLKVLELEPGFIRAWNNLGVTRLRRSVLVRDPQKREEAYDQVLETFNEMIRRFPDYPKVYYNRAQLRKLRGQDELAIADLVKAVELDPEYAEAKKLLGNLRGF